MKVFDFFHRDRRATKAGGEGFAYPPEDGYPPSPDDKANKKGRRIKYNRKSLLTYMSTTPEK